MAATINCITKEELSTARPPAELLPWVEAKIEEIAHEPGGIDALRMRHGLCKVLVEEVYALSIWARHRFSSGDDVTIKPVLGNQNFDALVLDSGPTPPNANQVGNNSGT